MVFIVSSALATKTAKEPTFTTEDLVFIVNSENGEGSDSLKNIQQRSGLGIHWRNANWKACTF